jgi:hypothetical protein
MRQQAQQMQREDSHRTQMACPLSSRYKGHFQTAIKKGYIGCSVFQYALPSHTHGFLSKHSKFLGETRCSISRISGRKLAKHL